MSSLLYWLATTIHHLDKFPNQSLEVLLWSIKYLIIDPQFNAFFILIYSINISKRLKYIYKSHDWCIITKESQLEYKENSTNNILRTWSYTRVVFIGHWCCKRGSWEHRQRWVGQIFCTEKWSWRWRRGGKNTFSAMVLILIICLILVKPEYVGFLLSFLN